MAKSRQLWFAVHSWIGVKLFLALFVILASGALATVSYEIDWLLNPALRATADPEGRPMSWARFHDAVRAARPEVELRFLHGPRASWYAAEAQGYAPDGSIVRIYYDPGRDAVTGQARWINVQRFLRNLHMGLFLPAGIYVVGAFGFALLVSLAAGLVVYRRFWRGFFRLPRLGSGRALAGDLHRLLGVWSIWFVLLIGLTGAWYFVEMALNDAGRSWERRGPKIAERELVGRGGQRIGPAEIERVVASAWPGFAIDYMVLPQAAEDPILVGGHAEAVLVRSRANLIYLDPFDGRVLRIKRGHELPVTERWVDTADPLHFGDFGGLASKLVWFVFGLALSALSFTGFWIAQARLRRAVRLLRARPAQVEAA